MGFEMSCFQVSARGLLQKIGGLRWRGCACGVYLRRLEIDRPVAAKMISEPLIDR